jgi:hypothetical protein
MHHDKQLLTGSKDARVECLIASDFSAAWSPIRMEYLQGRRALADRGS